MARIRTIKPEFFTSSDVVSLTPLSRLFYISLWCEADREGRLKWDTQTFKLRYFPADQCNIIAMGDELIAAGLVIIYQVDGRDCAEIPTFKSHQVINNREAESIIPPRVKEASKRRESGDSGEGRKEGKGREDASFDLFWSAWPNKVSKSDALKAWEKIKPDTELLDKILKAVRAQSLSDKWLEKNGQFIPHPATWLNGARWEDAVTPPQLRAANDASGGKDDPRWKGAK